MLVVVQHNYMLYSIAMGIPHNTAYNLSHDTAYLTTLLYSIA